jgi:hypothetical protein
MDQLPQVGQQQQEEARAVGSPPPSKPPCPLLPNRSGYDFGYLLKVLTCSALPDTEKEFFSLLPVYFPNLYDIKYLMASCDGFHGGLNKLGDDLGVSPPEEKHGGRGERRPSCRC